MSMTHLDTTNVKARKGLAGGRSSAPHLQAMFYMEAADATPGVPTVCAYAESCVASCLNYSGGGPGGAAIHTGKRKSRQERTRRWWKDRAALVAEIRGDIDSLVRFAKVWAQGPPWQEIQKGLTVKAKTKFGWTNFPTGDTKRVRFRDLTAAQASQLQALACLPAGVHYTPVLRLNGTSDVEWMLTGLPQYAHSIGVKCLEYTKNPCRMARFLRIECPVHKRTHASGEANFPLIPPWYHHTFSMGGKYDSWIPVVLGNGGNVTMVFDGVPPTTFGGTIQYKTHSGIGELRIPETICINGDLDDLRFLDEVEKQQRGHRGGAIVGLKFKRVSDPGAMKALADAVDPLKGFVHDPGNRERHHATPRGEHKIEMGREFQRAVATRLERRFHRTPTFAEVKREVERGHTLAESRLAEAKKERENPEFSIGGKDHLRAFADGVSAALAGAPQNADSGYGKHTLGAYWRLGLRYGRIVGPLPRDWWGHPQAFFDAAQARENPSACPVITSAAFRFGCGGTTAPYRWR